MTDTRATARRVLRRTGIPAPSTWHHTLPGAGALYERRWQRRIARAPVLPAAEHAVAVADPGRRGAAIEHPGGCSLCGDSRVQPLMHPRDRRHDPPEWDYHVVRCPGCGLLFRHPGIRAERLGDLYAGGYSSFLSGGYARQRKRRYRIQMDAFAPLFDEGEGRRLLDFGCGTGLFLDVAHERGFACHGVDLAPDAVAVARRKPSGAHVHVGAPAAVPEIAAGGFQLITLWSVLAHLATPVEDLTALRRLLAPDGVLLVLTVNADALLLRRELDRWGGFTTNHLNFFSPTTLALALRRAGFAALVTRPQYGDQIESGSSPLTARQVARYRRSVDRGNRGNMLRAAAFADPDGPARWGLQDRFPSTR